MAINLEEQLAEAQRKRDEQRQYKDETERLAQQYQEEQQDLDEYLRMQEFEEAQQRQRTQAQILAQDAAKKAIKEVAKKVATRTGMRAAIVATSEIWGPILGVVAVIAVILGLVFLVTTVAVASCNDTGGLGWATWFTSKVLPGDFCNQLSFQGGRSGGAGATAEFPPPVTQLVNITGVPVDPQTSDPRLRPCMLGHVQALYNAAQRNNIDFVITSANRPGAVVAGTTRLSAHGRGEAVDIAIRPTGTLSDPEFQRKVRTLVALSTAEGFRPPRGDTLDEYNRPTEGASGGHIHIEFNSTATGSYCDVT